MTITPSTFCSLSRSSAAGTVSRSMVFMLATLTK
jgi:hypothetical protein